ncbi:hypothetical protein X975_20482, partial [Stegodyphus mimosarum]
MVSRIHQSAGCRELTTGAQGRQLSGEEQREFQARLFAVSQECPWLYAYEDSPQRRPIHSRTVQQSIFQHSRNDSPLLNQ